MKREYDFSKAKRGAVVPSTPGKTRITIRLDDEILRWFRDRVHAAGGGNYQTLVNTALREHVARQTQPLERVLREVLREELSRSSQQQAGIDVLGYLKALFDYQDHAANYNLTNSPILARRVAFLQSGVELAASVLTSMKFQPEKQHAIRVVGADTLSSLVVSARIGLWGNLPESVALLRSALESAAILGAAVTTQKYRELVAELGERRFRRWAFQNAVRKLGDTGQRLRALHGQLSNLGPHTTGARLRFGEYTVGEEQYDRLGSALDPEAAAMALTYSLHVVLHLALSLEEAFLQDGIQFPFTTERERLVETFPQAISW